MLIAKLTAVSCIAWLGLLCDSEYTTCLIIEEGVPRQQLFVESSVRVPRLKSPRCELSINDVTDFHVAVMQYASGNLLGEPMYRADAVSTTPAVSHLANDLSERNRRLREAAVNGVSNIAVVRHRARQRPNEPQDQLP